MVLDGLAVRLGRDASGRGNLDDILARSAPGKGAARGGGQAAEAPEAASPADALDALVIGSLRVSGATLTWDDRQSGARYAVNGLDLSTGSLASGQPVDLTLRAALAAVPGPDATPLDATRDLGARRAPGPDFTTLAVQGLKLALEARGETLPGGAARAPLAGALLAALNADPLALPPLPSPPPTSRPGSKAA